jgi:hypothetical protein
MRATLPAMAPAANSNTDRVSSTMPLPRGFMVVVIRVTRLGRAKRRLRGVIIIGRA